MYRPFFIGPLTGPQALFQNIRNKKKKKAARLPLQQVCVVLCVHERLNPIFH